MIRVRLGLEHRRFTGGATEVEIEAANVKQLIAKLEGRFPGLGELLRDSAVAINDEILPDAEYEPLPEGAHVQFVPKAAGG